jgi:hypothetical protein
MAIFIYQRSPLAGDDYPTQYPVVTVELDEQAGLRFSAPLVGAPNDEVRIGRRAELAWIKSGGVPVPTFRLTARQAVP